MKDITALGQEIQALDGPVWKAIQEIEYGLNAAQANYEKAEEYRRMYQALMASLTGEDSDYYQMEQATQYRYMAAKYEKDAEDCYAWVEEAKKALRPSIAQYDAIKAECELNIQMIGEEIQKMGTLMNNKYAGGVSNVLNTAKSHLNLYAKWRNGCITRINQIKQLCGDGGDQPYKVKKL